MAAYAATIFAAPSYLFFEADSRCRAGHSPLHADREPPYLRGPLRRRRRSDDATTPSGALGDISRSSSATPHAASPELARVPPHFDGEQSTVEPSGSFRQATHRRRAHARHASLFSRSQLFARLILTPRRLGAVERTTGAFATSTGA